MGFVSTYAFAEEPASAETQPADEAKAEQPVPVAPVAIAVEPAPAAVVQADKPKVGDITTHGYFRGGFGASVNQKGRMTCFQLNLGGILSKYRLGNECEVWAEMEFTRVMYVGEDGVVANIHFMPVAYIPTTYIGYTPTGVTSSDQGAFATGATVAFPNLYADIKGISWLSGGTAWLGTRYYKRESVYISDFFYWNPSGVGAGIEDINVANIFDWSSDVVKDLKFSYGAFAVDGQPTGSPSLPQQYGLGIRNDFQLRGFRPWSGADFQLGFQYIADWSGSTDSDGNPAVTHGGWGATFQFVQDLLGGNNKVALQYGRGGGTGFGTLSRFYYPDFSLNYDTSEWRFRALDVITIQPLDWFGMQANVVWQHDKNSTPSAGDWVSAGTRLAFGFVEHAKALLEVGHDQLWAANGSGNRQLTKVTGALAIAGSKGFWGRPELRAFYTWAMWDQAAAGSSVDSGKLYTYPDPNTGVYKLSGSTAGLQAEAIW
jgi:maltoporin